MIDNPIPDIPFNGGGVGLTEEFLSGVQEQMSKQGLTSSEQQIQMELTRLFIRFLCWCLSSQIFILL